jgi:anthranilate synthase component 2
MGQAFGGTIVRAKNLMHGKTDMIHHTGRGLFAGLDNPFQATRYHSLVIQPDTLSPEFEMTAWSEEPGGHREIMGIAHREYPLFGVQFHPESFLTHSGYDILRRFLEA